MMTNFYKACRVLSFVAIGLIVGNVPARAQGAANGLGYWNFSGTAFTGGPFTSPLTGPVGNCTTAPAYSFTGDANNGWSSASADTQCWVIAGAGNLFLSANTLEMRNDASLQTFGVYGAYTDASNYSRLRISALTSSVYGIFGNVAGTGTATELRIGIGGGYMNWEGAGNLVPDGANSRGLGTAATPWANGYFATLLKVASGASLDFASKAVINTAPTISSGFGTSPSIVASNGTAAFTVNVGTGGTANSGVIGLPAATTGWAVQCMNTSTNTATVFLTKQTATTTTTATIGNYDAAGAAAAWVTSNVLVCSATAF